MWDRILQLWKVCAVIIVWILCEANSWITLLTLLPVNRQPERQLVQFGGVCTVHYQSGKFSNPTPSDFRFTHLCRYRLFLCGCVQDQLCYIGSGHHDQMSVPPSTRYLVCNFMVHEKLQFAARGSEVVGEVRRRGTGAYWMHVVLRYRSASPSAASPSAASDLNSRFSFPSERQSTMGTGSQQSGEKQILQSIWGYWTCFLTIALEDKIWDQRSVSSLSFIWWASASGAN